LNNILLFSSIILIVLPINVFAQPKLKTATFAGGCFWCVQPVFSHLKGVKINYAGYANGKEADPTYENYSEKGYIEAVQVTYDPTQVTYEQLLEAFWMQIDPTDAGGQFADRGHGYLPAIFFHDEEQEKIAKEFILKMAKSGKYDKPIAVDVVKFINFYRAEEYHQDYKNKNRVHYELYRSASGRDAYLKKIWGNKPFKFGNDITK
jgi:peptide methionine sulfoxide reductase msrA/msrB